MTNLQEAVETTAPVSRLHERRSYDPADFGVPSGREEEWRFTPLRRLRGLHADALLSEGKVSAAVDAAPEVAVELARRGDPRLGIACVPADRGSARAFASFTDATVVTVPAAAESTEATWIYVRGEDAAGAAAGHLGVDVRADARAVGGLEDGGSAS